MYQVVNWDFVCLFYCFFSNADKHGLWWYWWSEALDRRGCSHSFNLPVILPFYCCSLLSYEGQVFFRYNAPDVFHEMSMSWYVVHSLIFSSTCRLIYVGCLVGRSCRYEQGWVSLAQFLSTKSDVSWCACLGGLPVCVIFVCISSLCAWNLLSYHDIKRGCVLVYLLNRQILVHYWYRASRWSARVALALCFPLDSCMVFGCLA